MAKGDHVEFTYELSFSFSVRSVLGEDGFVGYDEMEEALELERENFEDDPLAYLMLGSEENGEVDVDVTVRRLPDEGSQEI